MNKKDSVSKETRTSNSPVEMYEAECSKHHKPPIPLNVDQTYEGRWRTSDDSISQVEEDENDGNVHIPASIVRCGKQKPRQKVTFFDFTDEKRIVLQQPGQIQSLTTHYISR